jgi:hypothetical protein
VAYAVLSADAFLRVDGSFQYPPFPALSESYRLPAPIPAPSFTFGSCTTPHLLRYGVIAGVRNMILQPIFDLDIGSSISSYLRFIDSKVPLTPKVMLDLKQVQIVSGCLLPMSASQPGLDQKLQLRSPTALGDAERSALAFNLAMDISSALGIAASRVRVELHDNSAVDRTLGRVVHHTMALPHAVGTGGREMRTQATSTVTAATVTVISPSTGASGMSAAAATQALLEQLATASSDLNKGVAASKFAPPGQPDTKGNERRKTGSALRSRFSQLLMSFCFQLFLSFLSQ